MRDAAIVGVGCTGFKSITPDMSYKEMMFEAATRAYADAGVNPRTRHRLLHDLRRRLLGGLQHLRRVRLRPAWRANVNE